MSGNTFFAVDPTEAERHAISAALTEASPGPRVPGRRVRPENWHVTLRFIGEIDEVWLDRVVHEAERQVEGPSGRVTCSGLGAFPRASKASVVYVAVIDREGLLESLAARCESACRDAGLEPEERRFVPHLTIARVRPQRDVRRLFDTFGEFAVPLDVREVSLMRSVLNEGGVRYETLHTFSLG